MMRRRQMGVIPYYEAQAGYRGLGSPMQRGQGHDFRDGSLGMTVSATNQNLVVMAVAGFLGVMAVKQGYIKKGFLGT